MWGTVLKYVVPALASAVGPAINLIAGNPKAKLDDIKMICERVKTGELDCKQAVDIIAELIAK